MPLSSQKQVMAGLDKLAGRALRRASDDYRAEVVRPMVSGIKKAKSFKGLMRQLGPGLLRRMKTERFERNVSETLTQAELVGRTAGLPRSRQPTENGEKK